MKYVLIPADIKIVNKRTGKAVQQVDGDEQKDLVFSMKFLVDNYICNAAGVAQALSGGGPATSGDALRRMMKFQGRMERLFESAKEGDLIGIEDADYKIARKVVDAIVWPPEFLAFAPQVLPLIEAWENADKQDEEWKKQHDAENNVVKLTHSDPPGLRAG